MIKAVILVEDKDDENAVASRYQFEGKTEADVWLNIALTAKAMSDIQKEDEPEANEWEGTHKRGS